MLAAGIVFIILGIISAVVGNSMNNNMDMQFESFFENGQVDPGDIFLYLGLGLILLGIILVIAGIARNAQKSSMPPLAMYGASSGSQTFKCCRCGYTGFYSKTCPVCKSKQTMLPYNGHNAEKSAQLKGTSEKKCPNCGATVSEESKFCNKCGSSLSEKLKCEKCGTENNTGDAFCANCGNKL